MEKQYPAQLSSVPQLTEYIGQILDEKKVNKKLIYEYQLLLEEIAAKLIDNAQTGADLTLTVRRRLGRLTICLDCPGAPVSLEQADKTDLGGLIIRQFSDYMSQSYSSGVNRITFSSSTASTDTLVFSAFSLVLSFATAAILSAVLRAEQIRWLNESVIIPIVQIFTSLLGTIATPVAFFSLASLTVKVRLTLDREQWSRSLLLKYFLTSCSAIVAGILWAYIYKWLALYIDLSAYRTEANYFMGQTMKDFLSGVVPANILEPFSLSNPLPLLILALLTGLAAGSIFGDDGNRIRNAVSASRSLFCRMLNILYDLIPLFLFFALLSNCLLSGAGYFLRLLRSLLMYCIPLVSVFFLYIARLIGHGISPADFFRKYGDILWENFKIGSSIQALPYNNRLLGRRTKLPSARLRTTLQLGADANMDGNCLVTALAIFMLLFSTGTELSGAQLIGMLMTILLLSIGAPNQPGSLLIASAVLLQYAGISPLLNAELIIVEAFLGKLYSFLNTAGDIFIIVISDTQTTPHRSRRFLRNAKK